MQRRWAGPAAMFVAASVALICVTLLAVRASETGDTLPVKSAPPAKTAAPGPTEVPYHGGPIGAVTTLRKVFVRTKPDLRSRPVSTIRAGILLPALDRTRDFVKVMTPCERVGWIPIAGERLHAQSSGRATAVKDATFVIDPGHGGSEKGATGPTGLPESTVNLDVAKRISAELGSGRVFLTRSADYMAGLAFRATLANNLHAGAFLSVHNNAQPDGFSAKPGTETYFQVASPASKRLAGLTYEELFRALRVLRVKWVSDKDAGAKYRTNPRGQDFYAVLRRSHYPAAITESLFISNAPEEALLRQGAVRQTIADALARALRRYVTTKDPGSGFVKPLLKNEGSRFVLPSNCADPS